MTSLSSPTYVEEGVVHYTVPNMPALVARTATLALADATLPYVVALADKGWEKATSDDGALALGLNAHDGKVYNKGVADAFGMELATLAG